MPISPHGKVYIVGAGPGNPSLMTLRAVDCLKSADVVLHDRLIPKEVLLTFAPHAKLIYVGKKASFHTLSQDNIEDLLVQEAKKGKNVVRLKGGDPFIFGRGGEECERLYDEGIDFEVVPGVSSAFAVPLYAGIPLTHRKFASGIAIVTGHENPKKGKIPYQSGVEREASTWVDWPALSRMGTIVFLMGIGNIRANMEKLKEHGKPGDTPVAVIRWGGLGRQKSLQGTINTIADQVQEAGLKAPANIVVGGVVGLSKKINWFERQPLFGKTILITRDEDSNVKLSKKLLENSADVISWPSFRYLDSPLSATIKNALKNIRSYDWIIFTSTRAVLSFIKKYKKIHNDFRPMMSVKIAAVGKETARILEQHGLWVDLIPKITSTKGLVAEQVFKTKKRLKILLPQAKDAKEDFIEAYQSKHHVCALTFYSKKVIKQDSKEVGRIQKKKIDWVLFYSPSAVESFMANFSDLGAKNVLKNTKIAVIGQTTKASLLQKGIQVTLVAKKASTSNLIHQILTY